MSSKRLPSNLIPKGTSLLFDEASIPKSLRTDHSLVKGRWGVLHILSGSVTFVQLPGEERVELNAPDLHIIEPTSPHYLKLAGPVSCRIDFFRDMEGVADQRSPGEAAREEIRESFARCGSAEVFASAFYKDFVHSSDEVSELFKNTDFQRQNKLLYGSVKVMVEKDISDPSMRTMLDTLGASHGRGGLAIKPGLYENWLNSVCDTVEKLDPQWNSDLERKWRLRLRAGVQVITSWF